MKKIVHIVYRDKFTEAYINFFKLRMPGYEHVFFTQAHDPELSLANPDNVFYIDHYFRVFRDKTCLRHLRQADKVIFSGVFTPAIFFVRLLCRPQILRKFYFHFWGGDFYHIPMKFTRGDLRGNAKIAVRKLAYRFSAGLVFLIPGEYEKFVEITGVGNRHLLAPIPLDPRNKPWHEYISPPAHPGETYILLGNSASPSNCHEQGMELLRTYAQENIRIFCPLSYGGPQEYACKVAALGKEIFGNRFVPLTNMIEYEEYRRFLSGIDVAVFPNNRQQAMGNINGLLCMGKKVYIRQDTSMWKLYEERDLTVFDYCGIRGTDFNGFIHMDGHTAEHNIETGKKTFDGSTARAKWEALLEDRRPFLSALRSCFRFSR